MQPFAELRHWTRRASTGEKASTAVAGCVVLTLLIWVLIPVSANTSAGGFGFPSSPSVASATTGPATTQGGVSPRPGPSGATSAAAVPVGSTGMTAPQTGGSAPAVTAGPGQTGPVASTACPSSSAPGVSSREITIAVTIPEIVGPAGNRTFGLPTVDEQKQKYDTVIASVNATGGVACRKLVPKYYTVNPADESDMHAKCLDISNAGVFGVIDDGGEYANADCFGQHHIPFMGDNLLFADTARTYYPYVMSAWNLYDNAYRTAVFGLKQRGFFDPSRGFRKLGFMYFSCHSEVISEMTDYLHQAGLSDSDIVGYDAGCPSPPLASPSDIQQAILKFKSSGVTNVTFAYFLGSIGTFTKVAQQQGFHPKYGLADDGYIGVSYGTSKPDPANFNGAITITTSRYGEEHTPSYKPTAGTTRCNRIFVKARLTPIYQEPAASNGGWVCDLVWMFQAAVDSAPSLSQNALAAGLMSAKSLDFSYPGGPNDFAASHGISSGSSWRVAEYAGGCACWKLADATYHPT
jgi:hypothetical protein